MSTSRAGAEATHPASPCPAPEVTLDGGPTRPVSGRQCTSCVDASPLLWGAGGHPTHCLLSKRLGIPKLSIFHIPSAGREVFLLLGNVA